MKHYFLILAACLLASCDYSKDAGAGALAPEAGFSITGGKWDEKDFTPWMSRAELQFLQEKNPADKYFARVEGRTVGFRNEYRALVTEFPSEIYDQWAIFWGIAESELFSWEMRLLKSGFNRSDMQVFKDSKGEALYQIVWLRSASWQPEAGAPVSDPLTSEKILASQRVEDPDSPEMVLPSKSLEETPAIAPKPPAAKASAKEPAEAAAEVAAPERAIEIPEVPLPSAKPNSKKMDIYKVRPGDTLWKVARDNGTTVEALKKQNSLRGDFVKIGQRLEIP